MFHRHIYIEKIREDPLCIWRHIDMVCGKTMCQSPPVGLMSTNCNRTGVSETWIFLFFS